MEYDNHVKLYDMEFNRIPRHYSGPVFCCLPNAGPCRFYTWMDSIITLTESEIRESHMGYNGDSYYFTDTAW